MLSFATEVACGFGLLYGSGAVATGMGLFLPDFLLIGMDCVYCRKQPVSQQGLYYIKDFLSRLPITTGALVSFYFIFSQKRSH